MNHAHFINYVTLFVTIIYGSWGAYLAIQQIEINKRQEATSLDIEHFNKLLGKTDTVIRLSYDQLKLNLNEQKITNANYLKTEKGNMNMLYVKLHQISALKFNIDLYLNGFHPTQNYLKVLSDKLEEMKRLFEDDMGNTYIYSDDSLTQLWSIAYRDIGNFNLQMVYGRIFVGNKVYYLDQNPNTNDVVDSARVKSLIDKFSFDIFFSIGAVTFYGLQKIEKDKIRNGILNKNGKYKIIPEKLWR